jgi:hypothetical protein
MQVEQVDRTPAHVDLLERRCLFLADFNSTTSSPAEGGRQALRSGVRSQTNELWNSNSGDWNRRLLIFLERRLGMVRS